ncbi:MAG: U32 family peptidase [Paludibacteraceae bacterium]|nr:U32 family peptidase [Paludibacteraceae bacterium]
MSFKRSDFEIMAPVGSYESLAAAIQAGANSVYFGIGKLNMRSHSANNFTVEDLAKIASICKENGLKSYLTLNTVMYDEDLSDMRSYVDAAKDNGISAIIASDMSVILYAVSVGVEVHLSTQLNISNAEALKFYAQFADVVVLARELNMDQVKHIHEQIKEQNICGPKGELLRIEMFCHGALCMAISGKCYMSLHELNASANRGSCYQVCRHSYRLFDDERDIEIKVDDKYLMSPKDLKTIHFLNKLIDSGVRVFKIEGRARSAEYVKTVVSCYDEALHSYLDNTFSEEKIEDWNTRLSTVFNRGFWNGYYLGQRLGEWSNVYGSEATTRKVYIGKNTRYYSKIGVAEFLIETKFGLKKGDSLLITGPTTGVIECVAEEIHLDCGPVESAERGQLVSIKVPVKIRPSDRLYKIENIK